MSQRVPHHDGRGSFVAGMVAVLLLVAVLAIETQAFAAWVRYSPILGKPVVAHWYIPTDTLRWMVEFDYGVGSPTNARPLVHRWFESERKQLGYAVAAVFAAFFAVAALLDTPVRLSDVHGGARWASRRDLRRSSLRRSRYGVVLGQTRKWLRKNGELLIHGGPQNVLGIGPPNAGKTSGIAVPTLLLGWRHWSAIVFDPAAELVAKTRANRELHGRVLVFDPRDPGSVRYNPLAGLATGDVDAVRTLMAAYLLDRDLSEMTEQERFFNASALELGVALVIYSIEMGAATLSAATRYYYDPAWASDSEFFESLFKSQVPYVTETASKFARMSERQRSPIVATLTQQLDMFRSPAVERVTSASDFHPQDLRREPTTLYLVVREKDQPSLNPLMRMLLTRLLDDLTDSLPTSGDQPILLLIDEFPLLRAPVIQRKLATMRKYRIRAVLLAQTLTQIRGYYGQNESITGLSDVRVFFPSLDGATQDLASKTCGQTTRWGQARSVDGQGRVTRSRHETGRPLLYAHELGDLAATGEIIVAVKGEPAIRAQAVRPYGDHRFIPPPSKKDQY